MPLPQSLSLTHEVPHASPLSKSKTLQTPGGPLGRVSQKQLDEQPPEPFSPSGVEHEGPLKALVVVVAGAVVVVVVVIVVVVVVVTSAVVVVVASAVVVVVAAVVVVVVLGAATSLAPITSSLTTASVRVDFR